MRVAVVNIIDGPDRKSIWHYNNLAKCLKKQAESEGYTVEMVESLEDLRQVLNEEVNTLFFVDPEMVEEANTIHKKYPGKRVFVYPNAVSDEKEQIQDP